MERSFTVVTAFHGVFQDFSTTEESQSDRGEILITFDALKLNHDVLEAALFPGTILYSNFCRILLQSAP